MCFKGTCTEAFEGSVTSGCDEKSKRGAEEMEDERREGEGWTEGSLKA